MKWEKTLHGAAAGAAGLGVLALVGAWAATWGANIFGMSEAHLFNDAQSLFLASIAFGIGTLIHKRK
jgi:hypothetical protein